MNKLDFDAINMAIDLRARAPEWAPGGYWRGDEWVTKNPTRADRNAGSFVVNVAKGVWKDFATHDAGSDATSLFAYIFHNNDQGAAAKELADSHGVKIGDPVTRERAAQVVKLEPPKPEVIFPVPLVADTPTFKHPSYGEASMRWEYRDREGRLLMYVCRFDPPGERKQVIPRSWCKHPDGTERWTWRGITGAKKRPLYGLDRLAADPEADAIVVEGEKATDAGQRLFGSSAIVCSWMGGVETADRVNINALAGRRVVLWPDFDSQRHQDSGQLLPLHEQPGMRAMMALATALKGVAREVVMVAYRLEEMPHGWDLADAEADGWTAEQVAAYMAKNAGDPWHIASGKPKPCSGCGKPLTAEEQHYYEGTCEACEGARFQDLDREELAAGGTKPPANDNTPRLPLDASVNPFGFPHMSDKGQPLNTVENLQYMLAEYGITCAYNIVRKYVEVNIPGRDYGDDLNANCVLAEISSLCSRNRMPKTDAPDYIKLISSQNQYNPVEDFIRTKPWDGVSRFPALCATLTTPEGYDRSIMEMLLRRWLISAAAAALKPRGFWSKGVLVLQGAQSEGKTSWIKSLLPPELRKLLKVGATIDPANKDSVSSVISHWLVELGELDGTFRKADIARLKGFISQDIDQLRRPYDRLESEYQRRTVFFASVNPKVFLVDDTGNVRWWTIPVTAVDALHTIDVQQLWAEVTSWFEAGERWWLTKDEEARLEQTNTDHQEPNTIEELTLARFDWQSAERTSRMSASEVLLAIGYDKPNNKQAKDMGTVLRKLTGGEPKKSNGRQVFLMPRQLGELTRARMAGGMPGVQGGFEHYDEDRPF